MKKIYGLLIASTLMLGTGCDSGLLDIENPNEVTNTTYWLSADDAQAGVNACYSFLYKEGTWMRWLSFRYDLTSDEGWSSSPWIELGDWTRFLYNNYNFYEGNNVHWEHCYVGIFRCNQVLKNVPGIEMDETLKNQALAEASFLRALWYFQVNLLWEKGTLILEPQDANYIPSDASEAEIWEQIESDLLFARDNLKESYDAANLGRATKGAAKALLGKAYMQQGKFAEAKAELEWLISRENALYGLISNREDNFTHLDENNKEGIFEIQFSDVNKGGTGNDASMAFGFQRTQFYAPSGIGWGDGKARRWLVDEFLKEKRADGQNDLRLYASILYRGFSEDFPEQPVKYYGVENADWNDSWGTDPEDCYIRKYNTSYYRDVEDYYAPNNYRIMRYADILMNYAECIVETGGTPADAAVHVDKVRERAGMSKLADSQWSDCLNSKDAFMKRLQIERTLELCFEGWRWADLKRWGLLDAQAGIDELKARDRDFDNFRIGKHRRMPIPTIEVEISTVDDVPQLTQNPAY
ncbi:MAG TPA: RagB/SusD family nutrient uptake outer membrane protein [Porphyromonadaceae bacterium]|nr:RagB/SusD family nutrient uptake outer membrane protein [Porphyromonadaceae bacterium]